MLHRPLLGRACLARAARVPGTPAPPASEVTRGASLPAPSDPVAARSASLTAPPDPMAVRSASLPAPPTMVGVAALLRPRGGRLHGRAGGRAARLHGCAGGRAAPWVRRRLEYAEEKVAMGKFGVLVS